MSFGYTNAEIKELADIYYYPNNHLKSFSWNKFSHDEKLASISQAIRELELLLNYSFSPSNLSDELSAVYEQALWLLENTKRQKRPGDSGEVIDLSTNKVDEDKELRRGPMISPIAAKYLQINRVCMVRG